LWAPVNQTVFRITGPLASIVAMKKINSWNNMLNLVMDQNAKLRRGLLKKPAKIVMRMRCRIQDTRCRIQDTNTKYPLPDTCARCLLNLRS
jgi:hypothetical protein